VPTRTQQNFVCIFMMYPNTKLHAPFSSDLFVASGEKIFMLGADTQTWRYHKMTDEETSRQGDTTSMSTEIYGDIKPDGLSTCSLNTIHFTSTILTMPSKMIHFFCIRLLPTNDVLWWSLCSTEGNFSKRSNEIGNTPQTLFRPLLDYDT